jgi:hypothetical protein
MFALSGLAINRPNKNHLEGGQKMATIQNQKRGKAQNRKKTVIPHKKNSQEEKDEVTEQKLSMEGFTEDRLSGLQAEQDEWEKIVKPLRSKLLSSRHGRGKNLTKKR